MCTLDVSVISRLGGMGIVDQFSGRGVTLAGAFGMGHGDVR